jgi:hypothetical protein
MLLLAAVLTPALATAATLRVGPTASLKVPSAAAAVAKSGDTIEIEAGDYTGDTAVWTQSGLKLVGVGGQPHLKAEGHSAEGKAIWVLKGDDTVVDNIRFSGAEVTDNNGAGIRLEGTNLTVSRCYFHDNENGILTGANEHSTVLIERSVFERNGQGDGYTHNMYIGRVAHFTLRYSFVRLAKVGHQVKSRAVRNDILYNRIMDETEGTSSYLLDFPEPGTAVVLGNLMQQGPETENSTIINSVQTTYIVHNTIVNDLGSGYFVNISGDGTAFIANNILAGGGTVLKGAGEDLANITGENVGLVDPVHYDYRLRRSSVAVDGALKTLPIAGISLTPEFEYVHPANFRKRVIVGRPDAGALELSAAER